MSAQRLDVSQQFKESTIKILLELIKNRDFSPSVSGSAAEIRDYQINGTPFRIHFEMAKDIPDTPRKCTIHTDKGFFELNTEQSKELFDKVFKLHRELLALSLEETGMLSDIKRYLTSPGYNGK